MAATQPARSGIDFSVFRDSKLARELIERIRELVGDRTINLMEVCGTHTVSIGRYGFRSIMPTGLKLLSGPGCPVCVTANRDIDHAIALSNMDGAIITTFGDMMRVPGSSTSLAAQKAAGRDIRIVYSPLDALDIAEQNPERPVIFMGVGFETTTPTIAAAILEADDLDQSFAGKLPEKQKYRKLGKEKIKAKINFYAQNTAGKKLKQRDDACTGP